MICTQTCLPGKLLAPNPGQLSQHLDEDPEPFLQFFVIVAGSCERSGNRTFRDEVEEEKFILPLVVTAMDAQQA